MDKPHSFAGKVAQKYGKSIVNDYEQPEKFFCDMKDFYRFIDGIPYLAIEDLEKYELNRDIIINTIRRLLKICIAAKINIIDEMDRIDGDDPFDGLEEDIAKQKQARLMKVSGEIDNN